MKISLAIKLLIGFIFLDLMISCSLFFFLYTASFQKYLKIFGRNKLSIARTISYSINEGEHHSFVSQSSVENTYYKKYVDLLSLTQVKENDIHKIYTLNYFDNQFFYSVMGKANKDMLSVHSELFSLDIFFNPNNKLCVEYKGQEYTEAFYIEINANENLLIQIINEDHLKKIFIGDFSSIQYLHSDQIQYKVNTVLVNNTNALSEQDISYNQKQYKTIYKFIPKDTVPFEPGLRYIAEHKILEILYQCINSNSEYIDEDSILNSEYKTLWYIVPIENTLKIPTGLVVIETKYDELLDFKKGLLLVGLKITGITFFLTVSFAIFLSIYLTRPLKALTNAVTNIASGDLEIFLRLNRQDEFGVLAKNFTIMVQNLKIASEVQKNLLTEIITLNENLEKKVIARTVTIEEQSNELKKQMQLARRIQTSLLPEKLPNLESVDINYKYHPMMEVGGDFLDVFYEDESLLTLFICDVSGHGVPAAFLAVMVKMSLRECFDRKLSPSKAISFLHSSLQGKMNGYFVSAIYITINLKTGELEYANAGHLPMLLIRKYGKLESYNSKGRIISEHFLPKAETSKLSIEEGDRIILYTDGIIESRNKQTREIYGEHRFINLLEKINQSNGKELCERIFKDVKNFMCDDTKQFEDDLTILITEFKKRIEI